MLKDLQQIFDTLTPQNIRDIPVINDAVNIFIETLEDLSKESIDIKNIFQNALIKNELIKIYLDDLYHVLQAVKYNKKIIDRIAKTNDFYNSEYFKTDAIQNLADYITNDHFFTIKEYKQKKGTVDALNYIYDLINVFIHTKNDTLPFSLEEVEPFVFNLSTSVPEEFYHHIIRPLAHPLGFIYQYEQYVTANFTDYFPEEVFVYTINSLEIRCLQNDGSTITTDYHYYTDIGTGLVIERIVVDLKTILTNNTRTQLIIFDNGTYLKQVTDSIGQTTVYYMSADDVILVEYTGQCSIYFDYEVTFLTSLSETFSKVDFKSVQQERYGFSDTDLLIDEFDIGLEFIRGEVFHDNEHYWNGFSTTPAVIDDKDSIDSKIYDTVKSETYGYYVKSDLYIGDPVYMGDEEFISDIPFYVLGDGEYPGMIETTGLYTAKYLEPDELQETWDNNIQLITVFESANIGNDEVQELWDDITEIQEFYSNIYETDELQETWDAVTETYTIEREDDFGTDDFPDFTEANSYLDAQTLNSETYGYYFVNYLNIGDDIYMNEAIYIFGVPFHISEHYTNGYQNTNAVIDLTDGLEYTNIEIKDVIETHQEYNVNGINVWQTIGQSDFDIGDENYYIKAELITVETEGESYMDLEKFNVLDADELNIADLKYEIDNYTYFDDSLDFTDLSVDSEIDNYTYDEPHIANLTFQAISDSYDNYDDDLDLIDFKTEIDTYTYYDDNIDFTDLEIEVESDSYSDYDDSNEFTLHLENPLESHQEYIVSDGGVWYEIGQSDFDVGDGTYYIKAELRTITTQADSYMDLEKFNIFSADDNFDFGVWRGGTLLTDNNYSVWV